MKLYLAEILRQVEDDDGEPVDTTFFYSFLATNPYDARCTAEELYGGEIINIAEIPKEV